MNEISDFCFLTAGEVARAIGKKARAKREDLGLSRAELSKQSGVSIPTISRFETKGTATLLVMTKLAHALDAVESFEGLFGSSGYKSIEEFLKEGQV